MFDIPAKERLIYYGPQMLNVVSRRVRNDEYGLLPELRAYMLRIMTRHNGIGLSAPQVGIFIRYFIMETDEGDIVEFVNPNIERMWGLEKKGWEACLSLPPVGNGSSEVPRIQTIEVSSYTVDSPATFHRRELKGMDAIVFQHEFDHLEGGFFIDRLQGVMGEKERQKVLNSFENWKAEQEKARCKGRFPITRH